MFNMIARLDKCEISRGLFRYLGEAYLEMKTRKYANTNIRMFFSVNGVACVPDPILSFQSAMRTNGKRPHRKTRFPINVFFLRELGDRLFGLDVDTDVEIGGEKKSDG